MNTIFATSYSESYSVVSESSYEYSYLRKT